MNKTLPYNLHFAPSSAGQGAVDSSHRNFTPNPNRTFPRPLSPRPRRAHSSWSPILHPRAWNRKLIRHPRETKRQSDPITTSIQLSYGPLQPELLPPSLHPKPASPNPDPTLKPKPQLKILSHVRTMPPPRPKGRPGGLRASCRATDESARILQASMLACLCMARMSLQGLGAFTI